LVDVSLVKLDGVLMVSELVEVGCVQGGIVPVDVVPAMVVGQDEQDVWSLRGTGS
jgi:hypothetical protein